MAALAAGTAMAPAKAGTASGFGDYAGRGYAEIAAYAQNQAGNPTLAGYFAARARAAADGDPPAPAEVSRWRLPPATAREAAAARRRLIAALDAGGRERDPYTAAVAQVNFDCWLPQLHARKRGLPGSADCRRRFYVSLARLQRDLREPGTMVAWVPPAALPPVIRVAPVGHVDRRNVIEDTVAAGYGSCSPGDPGDPCRSTRARPDQRLVDCQSAACGGLTPFAAGTVSSGSGATAAAFASPPAGVAAAAAAGAIGPVANASDPPAAAGGPAPAAGPAPPAGPAPGNGPAPAGGPAPGGGPPGGPPGKDGGPPGGPPGKNGGPPGGPPANGGGPPGGPPGKGGPPGGPGGGNGNGNGHGK
jgi:hypothetical protein